MGAGVGDVVDVEAGVNFQDGGIDVVEDIAGVVAVRIVGREWIWQQWERAFRRREGEVLFDVAGVVAVLMSTPERVVIGFIQIEEIFPVLDIRHDDDFLVDGAIADDGIIDGNSSQLIVGVIRCRDEGVCDMRNVVSEAG